MLSACSWLTAQKLQEMVPVAFTPSTGDFSRPPVVLAAPPHAAASSARLPAILPSMARRDGPGDKVFMRILLDPWPGNYIQPATPSNSLVSASASLSNAAVRPFC